MKGSKEKDSKYRNQSKNNKREKVNSVSPSVRTSSSGKLVKSLSYI